MLFRSHQITVSALILIALVASFCGILQQLTRILLGARRPDARPIETHRLDGAPAMILLLGALLLFSVWLPTPLLDLRRQAAAIIGGQS